MDPESPVPEQTLFEQWREAARETHQFELVMARRALNSKTVSEEERRKALRLRRTADRLFNLFMQDVDARMKNLREYRRKPRG
jgi:hypothetical protein